MQRSAVDRLPAGIRPAAIRCEPITLIVKSVKFDEHTAKKELGCRRIYSGPLQAQNVRPLALDLFPHMIDFANNSVNAHACSFRFDRIEQNGNDGVNASVCWNSFFLPCLLMDRTH
jgi:hypothetical protein